MHVAGAASSGAGPNIRVEMFGPGIIPQSGLPPCRSTELGTLNSANTEPDGAAVYEPGFGGLITDVRPPAPSTTLPVLDIVWNSVCDIQRPTRVSSPPPLAADAARALKAAAPPIEACVTAPDANPT